MTTAVLFDAPGPRTVARHRIYTAISAVALAALLGWVFWRFYENDQFTSDKWEVFTTPDYARALLVDGLLKTLQMAGTALIGAVLLGFLLGVGKLSEHSWVRWPAWLVVEFFRAVPVLLLMIFLWYSFGIKEPNSAFWAVVVALTLYNGAVLAEVLRAGVNAVPKGQSEAAYAVGMVKTQVMNVVLMPQAVKIMLPAIISQCVVALKDTALGFAITAPGLTRVSKQIYLEFDNRVPTIMVVAAMFILVNLVLTWLATLAQKKFVGEKEQLQIGATGGAPLMGGDPTGGANAVA